jgi:MFS family permease
MAGFTSDPSAVTTGIGLAVFGLGFGMVTQVLITAVQNTVDRRELGIAMAVTGFFRGLGGAVGAAVLGAVFAAQAGSHVSDAGAAGLAGALRSDVIDGVQSVFLVAAPLAALALIVVLRLPESPLKGAAEPSRNRPGSEIGKASMRKTDEFRLKEASTQT